MTMSHFTMNSKPRLQESFVTKNALGDRMKVNYEKRYKIGLTRRTPVIIRVDGRAFHTLTRTCQRPFDEVIMESMVAGARRVLEHAQGAKLAYVQSDEVSFLLTDYDNLQTEAWFGNDLCKIVSVSAALMTQGFNQAKQRRSPFSLLGDFDSRAFNVPEAEVANYFLWRAQDWARNSLSMYAQAHFSHRQMYGKNRDKLHEMLHGIGKNWTRDLTQREKNGTFVIKADGAWEERCDVRPCWDQINTLVTSVLPAIDRPADSAVDKVLTKLCATANAWEMQGASNEALYGAIASIEWATGRNNSTPYVPNYLFLPGGDDA
jgi:tRNA(His) 5'-end guanylyltransferase